MYKLASTGDYEQDFAAYVPPLAQKILQTCMCSHGITNLWVHIVILYVTFCTLFLNTADYVDLSDN